MPLEAALKLAADDKDRLKAYRALVPSYRLLAEIDKMLEAQEFVIRHTDGKAGRSNAAGDLARSCINGARPTWRSPATRRR